VGEKDIKKIATFVIKDREIYVENLDFIDEI
jgi:hypothetical protein